MEYCIDMDRKYTVNERPDSVFSFDCSFLLLLFLQFSVIFLQNCIEEMILDKLTKVRSELVSLGSRLASLDGILVSFRSKLPSLEAIVVSFGREVVSLDCTCK